MLGPGFGGFKPWIGISLSWYKKSSTSEHNSPGREERISTIGQLYILGPMRIIHYHL